MAEGLVEFDSLVTHRFAFGDYLRACRIIEQEKDRAMKVLIDMDE